MGHLLQAQLLLSAKYPILLDKSQHITSLFVRDSHKRVMHGGVKSTFTQPRLRFWIVQGGQLVRKLLYAEDLKEDRTGHLYHVPLPTFREKEEPPFTYVGADFGGSL